MTTPPMDAVDHGETDPHISLRRTPLHARHRERGATMADFGGWEMPIEYDGTVAEHTAVREGVGMFDVSHMGYTEITGLGAVGWLNTILANDLDRIDAGAAQYTLLCDDDGGVIDDLIVYRIDDDSLFCVPNATNSDAVVSVLSAAASSTQTPSEITVNDRRDDVGIIAVQGPDSARVLAAVGVPHDHDYMSFTSSTWEGYRVIVARTGYTGEHGYEIIAPADALGGMWDALAEAGATPCGLGARDTLRTEMGYPLHGHELSAEITPVQARLAWAIGWDKADFRGASALRAERERGPHRVLRGLRATGRGIPRADMTVRSSDGEEIGITTSGTFSPTLKTGIALALLDPAVGEGTEVTIDVRGRELTCEVVRPPFVDSHVR